MTTRHHHHGPSSTRGLPVSERTPDAPLAALLSCVTVVCLATVSDHHWAWLLLQSGFKRATYSYATVQSSKVVQKNPQFCIACVINSFHSALRESHRYWFYDYILSWRAPDVTKLHFGLSLLRSRLFKSSSQLLLTNGMSTIMRTIHFFQMGAVCFPH